MPGAVIATALVAIIIAVASLGSKKARAATIIEPAFEKPPEPPSACDPTIIEAAIASLKNGTATVELLLSAASMAETCGKPETAGELRAQADLQARVEEEAALAMIRQPDFPPEPIPLSKDGKAVYKVETRGGILMAVPMFQQVLDIFKGLQTELVKAGHRIRVDGRIGDDQTLPAFLNEVVKRGFSKFPKTVGELARNAFKWTHVLRAGVSPLAVAGIESPLDGVSDDAWRDFVTGCNADMSELAPTVAEKLGTYIGATVPLDDVEYQVSLSGLLGLVSRAGMNGAKSWLENPTDRAKYPNTTKGFIRTNGIF